MKKLAEKSILTVSQIASIIESTAPLSWQESYDNSGLLLGSPNGKISKAILCTDITMDIIEEAIQEKAELIISHHPVIFQGLKRINPKTVLGKMIELSIKNNIAWYAAHTNFDFDFDGVNSYWSKKLNLQNTRILDPRPNTWGKLQVYIPASHSKDLADALFRIGCGSYQHYDSCCWQTQGEGSFRALESAKPYVGKKGKIHIEAETKIEMIYPIHLSALVEETIKKNHPYQQAAYDLIPLLNTFATTGGGIIGKLNKKVDEIKLLKTIKKLSGSPIIKHSGFKNRNIETIAFCGGSGAFLQEKAKYAGAQVLITGELKYHDYVNADPNLWLVELGHFESEQFTKQLIYERITKIFPNFATLISKRDNCPVFYF